MNNSRHPYRLLVGTLNLLYHHWRINLWRFHPLRFFRNLGKIHIDRPIFILGVQGGGLTLVSRMLRRHPLTISVTGNSSNWAGPDEMQNVLGEYLPSSLSGISKKLPENEKYQQRDWLYAIDELIPLYRKTRFDYKPESAKKFQHAIKLCIASYARTPQLARFVDKSQSFTIRLDMIVSMLKEFSPKFILITRNPYALCYRASVKVRNIRDLNMSRKGKVRLAAQHWANSYNCALEDIKKNADISTLSLRFEDILKNPSQQLKDICDFVELDFHADMLPRSHHRFPIGSTGSSRGDQKWYPIRPDVNDPYLDKVEPWMIQVVDEEIEELSDRFNYKPPKF